MAKKSEASVDDLGDVKSRLTRHEKDLSRMFTITVAVVIVLLIGFLTMFVAVVALFVDSFNSKGGGGA